jgi:hypothetical protein
LGRLLVNNNSFPIIFVVPIIFVAELIGDGVVVVNEGIAGFV